MSEMALCPINPIDYYTNPDSYDEPWVTKKGKHNMVACMHPSCECRKQQRNKFQTPGGGHGVITDRQIAHIIETGRSISEPEAIDLDYNERNTSELDVHEGCAYWRFRTGIVHEMAYPSDFTFRTIERWREEIYFKDGLTKGLMDEVVGGAGVLVAQLPSAEQTDDPKLLGYFAETYRGRNVHKVEPIAEPVGTYVLSHLVNVVHNQRDRKHPETPMAYFDSLGATTTLTRNHGDDRSRRTADLMNASNILRSAAARTFIAGNHPMDLLEVTRKGKEIEFDIVTL